MNPDDFWIGDQVILKKSGRQGTFEGIGKNNKARVNINGKIVLSLFKNLELVFEKKKKRELDFKDDYSIDKNHSNFKNEIDLHIESLAPSLVQQLPQRILEKQIEACILFVQKAVDARAYQITIIHGIGIGQLKLEVEHILSNFSEVRGADLINNGGATLVTFRY